MIDLYYAEDDPNIANTVKEYLEQKDFKVTIYDTLASIKQALEIHVPAMVLLDWNMPDGRGTVTFRLEEINLSVAEYQLLLYLMQNKGKTVTREKILEQVWDVNGNYVNNNTLTVTMKRLRDKLDQPSCLKTVRSVGYRMEDTI